jgi:tRNA 2-thiouridine synthesizing protein C
LTKKILFIKKQFLTQVCAKESLDMALAGVSLGLRVSLLFIEDAVFHLMKSMEPEHDRATAFFKGLPFYGIETIYVTLNSLEARNLTMDDLIDGVVCLQSSDISELLSQHDMSL